MKGFWKLIMYFSTLSMWYNRIISDPEKREKSVYFGVQSIITSIVGATMVILCAFGVSALLRSDGGIVAIVFIALLALLMVVGLFEFTLRGLVAMIYQLRVNKRPIGWVALAVWIATFIATIALSIAMIAQII